MLIYDESAATISKTQGRRNIRQFSKQESEANKIQYLSNPLRQRHFLAVFCKTTKQSIMAKFWAYFGRREADFQCRGVCSSDFVHAEKEKKQLICRDRRSSLARPSVPFTSLASSQQQPQAFSLLCPLRLRFGVPIWAVVLLVVNPGIGVLPVRRWPNSNLLVLQSDFEIRINQVLLIPFFIIMISLWKWKMAVFQIVVLFLFVLRFILSLWIHWAIHPVHLI